MKFINVSRSPSADHHRRLISLHKINPSSINISFLYNYISFKLHPFWTQLSYFILISSLGFLFLKLLPNKHSYIKLNNLDVFFTAASAATVSSMSTVEIESFSDLQLLILTLLMLLGGEVFISMLTSTFHINNNLFQRCLSHVLLAYFMLIHATGYAMIFVYMSCNSSARQVLHAKGLNAHMFTIFTVVSSFSNCGFIPTNENMMVFKTCSGLLLIIIPLILTGNTLFPPCLKLFIWTLERITRREEFGYILKDHKTHLFPGLHSVLMLALTVVGFVVVQFILFCSMEWSSEGLQGMNAYQKIVGALFQSVNSRHAGESIVDLSTISPAILVLYLVMMYLPPYTSFVPSGRDEEEEEEEEQIKRDEEDDIAAKKGRRGSLIGRLLFSQLSYLSIFTIIICITERENISHDPLNFNVLNIATEIISAYGNVGFSTGYSCERQLEPDPNCKDSWVGFSGRWSSKGKLILIFIMFFGRLKMFNLHGGKAWKLS